MSDDALLAAGVRTRAAERRAIGRHGASPEFDEFACV
jgi:hypothetical protein